MTAEEIRVEITVAEAGQRLDRVLSDRLDTPRNQIQQWLRTGLVQLEGAATKAAHSVSVGEVFVCEPPVRDLRRGIEPEAGNLEILHEDSDLVVLVKPPGLVVHPGAGRSRGTLAHRLLARFPEIAEVGGAGRPGIVHRLDKDTSGVLVVARTPLAYEHLSRAFAERRVDKRYLALAYGTPRASSGSIEKPIGRHPTRRKEMAVRGNGRAASTLYKVLQASSGICLLEIDLHTGRTHQIRVHLKSLGHPLIGDPVYGEARWKGLPRPVQAILSRFPRPALHAWRLAFDHPTTGKHVSFEALLPEDMRLLWEEVTSSPLGELA